MEGAILFIHGEHTGPPCCSGRRVAGSCHRYALGSCHAFLLDFQLVSRADGGFNMQLLTATCGGTRVHPTAAPPNAGLVKQLRHRMSCKCLRLLVARHGPGSALHLPRAGSGHGGRPRGSPASQRRKAASPACRDLRRSRSVQYKSQRLTQHLTWAAVTDNTQANTHTHIHNQMTPTSPAHTPAPRPTTRGPQPDYVCTAVPRVAATFMTAFRGPSSLPSLANASPRDTHPPRQGCVWGQQAGVCVCVWGQQAGVCGGNSRQGSPATS